MAIGLAFSAGAMAQPMTKEQFKSTKDGIAAQHKAARASCASLSGNAKDICGAEASAREKIATAELDATYRPSRDTDYKARVARAEADYSVARQKCDDKAGNVKDVCVKEAEAGAVAAKADAKAYLKSADADGEAAETSAKANSKADGKSADARNKAASDKRDANFAVAKEK
ncbi:MAG TPA: hypothetical protein VN667_03020, partial [Burkholderiales bacterium]|nr:hypothetical protein [Burkholderiales bacterium]